MAVTISGSTGIDKVVDGSIAAVDLAANAVTTAKIADDAVTDARMQNLGAANRVLGATSTGAIGEVQVVDISRHWCSPNIYNSF